MGYNSGITTMGGRAGGGAGSGRGGGGGKLTGAQKYYAKMSRNEIAGHLTAISGASRWSNNSTWQTHYDEAMGALYAAAGKPNTFGGKIAGEIIAKTEAASKKYGKTLAPFVSAKQAWAIANALSTK